MQQEKEQEKENLIQICRGNGNLDEVRKILSRHPSLISEALDSDGWALIIYASRYNHIRLMEHLLASPEVNVNHQDNDGYTALQWASYRGYTEIVQLLLLHPNIDVNIQNKLGATALHRATYYGRVQIVRLLLSNGNIDVTLKSIKGRTASEVCCEWEKANQSVKPLIIELLQNHATSLPSAPPLPQPAAFPPAIPAVVSLEATSEVRRDDDWEVRIEEVRRCRELKFPSTLQLSFVCLKLLMIRDEIAQARSCKDYKRVSVLGEQKKLWTMWQEKLLRMTEKQVPAQLSSEATFNTAKGFFLEQLEAHFGLCLENCEDEKVLEGIDTFKEQIEAWQEGGVREGSLKPAMVREPSKSAMTREPSKFAMMREPSRRVSVMDPTPFGALSLANAFPLPPNKATHVFLTHTWKKDGEGRDNHQRVQRVNDALKNRGLVTWFDSEQMTGQIRQTMTDALYSTCCLLVFITREYENKVNLSEKTDNCYYEFNVAANCHLADARIPVVMEKSMSNPSRWEIGRLKAEIGDELFVDLSSDEEEVFEQRCDELVERVMGLLKAKYEGLY